MNKPHSVHKEHWTDVNRYTNDIFSKGFCHDHLLTWSADSITTKSNSFKWKQTITQQEEKNYSTFDDLRVQWGLNGGNSFYAHVASDYFKLHTDFGVRAFGGHNWNTYAAISMKRNGENRKLGFGFKNLSNHCHSDTRFRVDQKGEVELGNRTHIVHGNWRAAFLTVLDARRFELLKKDLVFGFVKKEWEVFFKAEQSWDSKTVNWKDITQWFTLLTLTGVYNRNSRETYGVEVQFDPSTKKLGDVSALVEYQQNPSNSVKVKINDKLNMSFLLKRVHTSQFSLSLGVSSPLNANFSKSAKVGAEIELFV